MEAHRYEMLHRSEFICHNITVMNKVISKNKYIEMIINMYILKDCSCRVNCISEQRNIDTKYIQECMDTTKRTWIYMNIKVKTLNIQNR